MRVTWIQPEDLVGHELRQAREEGKDVDAIEARWLGAGGAPAPARGASQEPRRAAAAGARARAARRARASCRGRSRPSEPDELRRDPRRGRSRRRAARAGRRRRTRRGRLARPRGRLRARQAGREHPARGHPRDRARAPATGRCAAGSPPRGSTRRCRSAGRGTARAGRRASPRTSTACRRTTTSTSRCSASSLLERCGASFTRLDVAKTLARLPAARPDLHRRARRDAQPARGAAAARDRDAPQPVPRVDRRAAARRRVRLGRRAATRRARRGWRGRTRALSHTANGVYAAMFMAAAHAASLARRRPPPSARTSACRSCPRDSRLAEAIAHRARRSSGEWEARRRRALRALRRATTGCTRSTTPRSSRRRCTRSTTFADAICAVVAGRLGHRHERRRGRLDLRRAAADRGALVGAAARPLRELAARLRRRSRSTSSRRRTLAVVLIERRATRSSRGRSTCRRRCRSTGRSTRSTARRSSPRPTIPADWPRVARARSRRWREQARANRLRRRRLRAARVRVDAELLRGRARLALGRAALRPRRPSASRPSGCSTRREREFGGFDGDRPLARLSGDRDRRAKPVRLVPRRARGCASSSRTSRRAASASSSTTTRGTPARGASRVDDARRSRQIVRELGADGVFLDTMKEAQPGLRAALGPRRGVRGRVDAAARADRATTTSRGRSGSPTAPCRA